MILQALKEFYDRKAADPDSDIAAPGWEKKEIRFVIELDTTGSPLLLEDTEELVDKKRRSRVFVVPRSVSRTTNVDANLLWDSVEYVLGYAADPERRNVQKKAEAFYEKIEALGLQGDEGIDAVKLFLGKPDLANALTHFGEVWEAAREGKGNLTFRLHGDKDIICRRPMVRAAIDQRAASLKPDIVCLVTGEADQLARIHPAIKGVYGARPSGANIVSFNEAAFCSFGRKQGANAPVGVTTALAYTTALNTLLGKGSANHLKVGDASTVFWAEKQVAFEDDFRAFFAEPQKDDTNHHISAVRALLAAPRSGVLAPAVGNAAGKFYVLGLSPNASRLSVRFWINDSIPRIQDKIRQHFQDLEIIRGAKDAPIQWLSQLLLTTAIKGAEKNIPPNLEGDLMRAILLGLPYPASILQAAIRRIKAKGEIPSIRAALIKACINRRLRFGTSNSQEELNVSLDTNNSDIGYRLGRLFATLEKIQEEANPNINATIRDRFYAAASSAPVTVFGRLMTLKNHHLAKLESPGRRINFEKLVGEIVSAIHAFPAHLNLDEQGRFAIGYYHQRQDFFTKKTAEQHDEPAGEIR